MSQENVELVRRLFEAYPELDALTEVTWDPNIEWQGPSVVGTLRGRATVLRYFRDFTDTFEGWTVVPDELIDVGDEVVAVTRGRGSGRASGAVVEARYAIVFTIRESRIVRAREFGSRTEALEAVELAE
jgi:ketosteroid isomerase-like protein